MRLPAAGTVREADGSGSTAPGRGDLLVDRGNDSNLTGDIVTERNRTTPSSPSPKATT